MTRPLIFVLTFALFSLHTANAQTTPFNAVDFLTQQNDAWLESIKATSASTMSLTDQKPPCIALRILGAYRAAQGISKRNAEKPMVYNSNGRQNVTQTNGVKLNGQSIQSTNTGYWLRINSLGSGLGGSLINILFAADSCTPQSAVMACGGKYYPVKMEGGRCSDEVHAPKNAENHAVPNYQCPFIKTYCEILKDAAEEAAAPKTETPKTDAPKTDATATGGK